MIMCKRKSDVDLGYVGEIEKVNTTLIDHLLADSFIPVIATVGMDDNGVPYNINADTAAAEIAIALHAEKLVSMTDIVGLLYDKNDESTLIPEVEVSEIEGYKAAGVIAGGMLPKIEGMADAIYQASTRPSSLMAASRTRSCSRCSATEAQARCFIGEETGKWLHPRGCARRRVSERNRRRRLLARRLKLSAAPPAD